MTARELRSLLAARPPAILFLNSHYTAFLPPGVQPSADVKRSGYAEAGPAAPIGFTKVAIDAGVGAFIGCFDSPMDESGRQFGVAVHKRLLDGAPIVDAVRGACMETIAAHGDDITGLQYVLAGSPGYCIVA